MRVSLARRLSEPWLSAVEFTRRSYADSFGADVLPDPDSFLVATESRDSSAVVACAGMSFASEFPFFSERYLDEPAESAIARRFGVTPARRRIVEVGPLAGGAPFAGREIIRLTPITAWCMGMQYILCTVTQRLARTLRRQHIDFLPFQAAEPDRLDAEQRGRWGSYYDDGPQVGVIALDRLSRLFSDATGRYCFLDVDIDLLATDAQREVLDHAAR